MTTVTVQQITFTKAASVRGAIPATRYNVDVDGVPFGQVWKLKDTKTCKGHLWNVSLADGSQFPGFGAFEDAQRQVTFIAGAR